MLDLPVVLSHPATGVVLLLLGILWLTHLANRPVAGIPILYDSVGKPFPNSTQPVLATIFVSTVIAIFAAGSTWLYFTAHPSSKEINDLETATPTAPTNPDVIGELLRLIDQGRAIQDSYLINDNPSEMERLKNAWTARVVDLLNVRLGISYGIEFKNTQTSSVGQIVSCPEGTRADGCPTWREIHAKREVLMQIISEIQKK